MKIVLLDGYTLNPGDLNWEGFERFGDLTVYDRTPVSEVAVRIGEAEIVLTNKTPVTLETIEACPNIRYIGALATGYNIIDTAAAAGRKSVKSKKVRSKSMHIIVSPAEYDMIKDKAQANSISNTELIIRAVTKYE